MRLLRLSIDGSFRWNRRASGKKEAAEERKHQTGDFGPAIYINWRRGAESPGDFTFTTVQCQVDYVDSKSFQNIEMASDKLRR